eukprot:46692_1
MAGYWQSTYSTNEIDNIPHEVLILGYLRQIYPNKSNHNMISNIINLCHMFYVNQTLIDTIDTFAQNKIKELSDLLDITNDESTLLLLKYKWNPMFITEKYFNNSSSTLQNAGCYVDTNDHNSIKSQSKQPQPDNNRCQSCVEFNDALFALDCGHKMMCTNCWIYYLKSSAYSPRCLTLTCPTPNCNVIVPRKVWEKLLSKQYQLYYKQYLSNVRQNCIDRNKVFTKCTNKKCKMVYFSFNGIPPNTQCSKCRAEFNCYKCHEPPHMFLSCDDAFIWRNEPKDTKRYESHLVEFNATLDLIAAAEKRKDDVWDQAIWLRERGWFERHTMFLMDVLDERIRCLNVLAWTYPLLYFTDETKDDSKVCLFKMQRNKLVQFCEGLERFLNSSNYNEVKQSVQFCGGVTRTRDEAIGYTQAARKYRQNILTYLETEYSI